MLVFTYNDPTHVTLFQSRQCGSHIQLFTDFVGCVTQNQTKDPTGIHIVHLMFDASQPTPFVESVEKNTADKRAVVGVDSADLCQHRTLIQDRQLALRIAWRYNLIQQNSIEQASIGSKLRGAALADPLLTSISSMMQGQDHRISRGGRGASTQQRQ